MEKLSLVRELALQMVSVIENDNGEQESYKPTPIETLKLSSRAFNSLKRGGVDFVEQLIWLDRNKIMRMRNMGQHSFDEINSKVKSLGLHGWE